MSILGAVIVPHPPLIIPAVGREREQEVQAMTPFSPISICVSYCTLSQSVKAAKLHRRNFQNG